jgi:hypothetical protein
MSVEIAKWCTVCNDCGDTYGNEWDDEEEAEAFDEKYAGICDECHDPSPTGGPTDVR